MYVLSQILVGVADLLYVLSMLTKKKSGLLLFLLFSDIAFAMHYFCLGALTGCVTIFIDVVLLLVVYLLEKFNKNKFVPIAAIVAMVATIIACILTWNGVISLLPLFSMLIYLVGMMLSNIVFVKCGAMCRNLLNIVYMILITSYVGAGLEFVLMMSALIGIILNVKKNKENKLNS